MLQPVSLSMTRSAESTIAYTAGKWPLSIMKPEINKKMDMKVETSTSKRNKCTVLYFTSDELLDCLLQRISCHNQDKNIAFDHCESEYELLELTSQKTHGNSEDTENCGKT